MTVVPTPAPTTSASPPGPTAGPTASDPCLATGCVLECTSPCGWAGGTDRCVSGEVTSFLERQTNVGCPPVDLATTAAADAGDDATSTLTTAVVAIVSTLACVGLAYVVQRRRRARRARRAAAGRRNFGADPELRPHHRAAGAPAEEPVYHEIDDGAYGTPVVHNPAYGVAPRSTAYATVTGPHATYATRNEGEAMHIPAGVSSQPAARGGTVAGTGARAQERIAAFEQRRRMDVQGYVDHAGHGVRATPAANAVYAEPTSEA